MGSSSRLEETASLEGQLKAMEASRDAALARALVAEARLAELTDWLTDYEEQVRADAVDKLVYEISERGL